MGTRKVAAVAAATAVFGAACVLILLLPSEEKEFRLVPKQKAAEGSSILVADTEVGTGWSNKKDPEEAAREAVSRALEGKRDSSPDFAVIFTTSGSDAGAILSEVRRLLGPGTKIYGGTSDSRAAMTDRAYVRVTDTGYVIKRALAEGYRGLAIMTVTSSNIVFGVGSADFSTYATPQEAAKAAILEALRSAGKSPEKPPKVVMTTTTIGVEEEVIEGIEAVVGRDTAILGGTTGGPVLAVFGQDRAYERGVSLGVIYTDLPVGWTFEAGFDTTDVHSGIVTEVDGQALLQIDGRPALDVYDEWLGGQIDGLFERVGKPDVIRDLLVLHPLHRKYTSPSGQDYFLFSHPWPRDNELKDRAVSTSTKIAVGERVYLSHGTWETLLNRIGNLPRKAKIQGNIPVEAKPILGIGYICGGVMGVIPDGERPKMRLLINYSNGGAPFIANFTWGEQGHFPGIGSKHGNLTTAFLVIGAAGQR